MKKQLSIAALLCAAALTASCTKDGVQDITGVVPAARIKFFNFGVNAPSVNFYANTTKMTAVTSATGAEATTGVAYGGVGAGGFYTGITPGTYTVNGKISAATDRKNSGWFCRRGSHPGYRLYGCLREIRQRNLELECDDAVRDEHQHVGGVSDRRCGGLQSGRQLHGGAKWYLQPGDASHHGQRDNKNSSVVLGGARVHNRLTG
jgi:hypothetical protein